jgi:hypothetical protein
VDLYERLSLSLNVCESGGYVRSTSYSLSLLLTEQENDELTNTSIQNLLKRFMSLVRGETWVCMNASLSLSLSLNVCM